MNSQNIGWVWAWCPRCCYRTDQHRTGRGLTCLVCGTVTDALGNIVQPTVIRIEKVPVALGQGREGGAGE